MKSLAKRGIVKRMRFWWYTEGYITMITSTKISFGSALKTCFSNQSCIMNKWFQDFNE